MSIISHYEIQPNEPSIFAEFYLPKKAHLQGILYEVLTRGCRLIDVKNYFRELKKPEDKDRMDRVRKLARPGWTVLQKDLSAKEIDEFPRIFFGYSMYEVDGVFLKEIAKHEGDPDENYAFTEERTQVIRLIFKYPCATASMEIINFAKAILRDPLSEIGEFEENYPELARRMAPETRDALKPLYSWIRYVGWFLYGFLAYQICEQITHLYGDEIEQSTGSTSPRPNQDSTIKQDEIWITTLWNMNVNVIRWHNDT